MQCQVRLAKQGAWRNHGTRQGVSVFSKIRYSQPRPRSSRAGTSDSAEAGLELETARPLVVKSIPQPRTPAAPPQPVPIEHSSAFLIRSRRDPVDDSQQLVSKKQQQAEAFNGNAVKWALKKADESLDEIEENPPEAVKAIYDISRGPVGSAAGKGVTTVAKLTWQVGTEAVKAATPVGKWALQQGAKLAVTAVTKGIQHAVTSKGGKAKK